MRVVLGLFVASQFDLCKVVYVCLTASTSACERTDTHPTSLSNFVNMNQLPITLSAIVLNFQLV